MARQLRRDGVEIVHGHNPGVHHFAAAAKRAAGVPVCINTRHGVISSKNEAYQERYFRWVERWTDQVVFVCDYVRKGLEPLLRYPSSKYSVILNGISYQPFLCRPASPGSKRPRIRFGTIGRLVAAKGQAHLIEAFTTIAARVPDADLRIYGYGPLESELRAQIARLGLEGRVRLEGRTEDAARVLESLDVFVLSSLTEGLPLVILEAMASGLPIVSTRVGGVSEVAPEGTTAWLCEPGNVVDLAAAMLRAATSQIDASAFNGGFPKVFPRFVQNAIWRFCAADGSNICNGNRIDDRKECQNRYCQLFDKCSHKPLKS